MPRAANEDQPVMAFVFDVGNVAAKAVTRQVIVAYDEIYAIKYFGKKLLPYWARNGVKIEVLLQTASKDYAKLFARCEAFDKELMADLVVVFAPEERSECLRRGEEMAGRWEGRYPAVAAMLREGLEDCLAVLDFPAEHRRRLQSTNLLENLMKRLKKRSRVVGVFPNRASCDRLLGAQLIEVPGLGHQVGTEYLREMLVEAPRHGLTLPDRELACAPLGSELGQRYLGAMRAASNCALANRQILTALARESFARLYPDARLEVDPMAELTVEEATSRDS